MNTPDCDDVHLRMIDNTPTVCADILRAVWLGDTQTATALARTLGAPSYAIEILGATWLIDRAERLPQPLGPVTVMVGEMGGGADDVMRDAMRLGPYGMIVSGGNPRTRQCIGDHMALRRLPEELPDYLAAYGHLPTAVCRLVGHDRFATHLSRQAVANSSYLWAAYAALDSLCRLAELHLPQPPVLLLPDLGIGLHPAAQTRLARGLFHDAPGAVQIIATTMSPEVVDAAELDAVLVFARDDEGEVHCKRLSEHPDAERHGRLLRPGEFWTTVGEEWVLE
jgi:hypothetical protein